MRVALVMWQMMDLGGILTYHKLLLKGFRHLGIDADEYWITSNKKVKKNQRIPSVAVNFGLNPDMPVLGFEDFVDCKTAVATLKCYDLLIFLHFGPRKTKRYNSRKWQEVYKGIKREFPVNKSPVVFVLYHDPFWSTVSCSWVLDVLDCIDLAATMHIATLFSLRTFPKPTAFVPFPMEIEDIGLYLARKENLIVQMNEFKAWKHNEILIKAAPFIVENTNYNIEIYGTGIQYHYGKYEIWWKHAFKNYPNRIKYVGRVPFKDSIGAIKRAKFLVNMGEGTFRSGIDRKLQGHPDYTDFEAMAYGTIPVVREEHFAPETFDRDQFIIIPYTGYGRKGDKEGLVKLLGEEMIAAIKSYELNHFRKMVKKNNEWVREKSGYDVVARRFLNLFRKISLGKQKEIINESEYEIEEMIKLRGVVNV